MVAGVVVLAVIGGVVRHVQLAPKTYAIEASDTASDSELAPVLASAKRDIG
jgi:hypothetical protein